MPLSNFACHRCLSMAIEFLQTPNLSMQQLYVVCANPCAVGRFICIHLAMMCGCRASTYWVCMMPQMRTSRTFLRDVSIVSPMSLLLFGGSLSVVHEEGYVLVDNWLRIRLIF